MRLKSLLAIVSCSAIALSVGVPSIAQTVKDSKVELIPTGIGNKQSLGQMFMEHSTKPLDFGSSNSTQQSSPAQIYEQQTEEKWQQYYQEKEAAQEAREKARVEAEEAERRRILAEIEERENPTRSTRYKVLKIQFKK